MRYKHESGQALVLILLSLSVVLTIILYILSRTVTDVAISSRQEESVRAFSAAEAGVEQALIIGTGSSSAIGDATYNASVTGFSQGVQDFPYPVLLSSGDSATTWFIGHDSDGNLTTTGAFTGTQMKVCWGNPGTGSGATTTPAIEISIYYESIPESISSVKVARAVFDPNAGRTATNSFTLADNSPCQIAGNSYAFQKTISFTSLGVPVGSYENPGGLQFARVKLLYNSDVPHVVGTTVNFAGNSVLPSQGISITSTGVAGGSNRKINVFQGWAESPFASNSLLVPTGITK
jgi:hypothetical protein